MPFPKPDPVNCVNCGALFCGIKYHPKRNRISAHGSRKTCSRECLLEFYRNNQERKDKISAAFTGDKHWNWQGGKARVNSVSRRGTGWQKARRTALKRDKYECQDCGKTDEESKALYGRGLDVDHIIPFHNYISATKANRLSNLITLCASCHRISEAKRNGVQMVLPLGVGRGSQHKGYSRGADVNTAKLNDGLVYKARMQHLAGQTSASLAREFGVTKSAMSQILRGRTWKHVPMPENMAA